MQSRRLLDVKKRIILLGDSITQGLESKKVNFTQELQESLGENYIIDNLAVIGTTIRYAEQILLDIKEKNPEYVVIGYGNVDAQIRPCRTGKVFPKIPRRFRGNGMLMPRSFYSHVWYKRILQRIENKNRALISKLIYAVDGTEQWVRPDEFRRTYQNVVTYLGATSKVIACSTVYIDEKNFREV